MKHSPKDLLDGVLIPLLDAREADIIVQYYIQHHTLREIGRTHNIGHERTRQIKAKASRKIAESIKKYPKTLQELRKLREQNRQLLGAINYYKGVYELPANEPWQSLGIEDLDINIRTRNGLYSMGYGRLTLNALYHEFRKLAPDTEVHLLKRRNFGRKSLHELIKGFQLTGVPAMRIREMGFSV